MPPPSDQDNSDPTSANDSKPAKVSQKTATANLPPKSGKKNGTAKDTGGWGVLAAVKKEAKINAKQTAQSTPSKSPEMKPVQSSPPLPPTVNPVSSPLIDALSSATFTRSTSHNSTNEWTKDVSGYSTSPRNLINLGESPPTHPSSYEDRISHFGWTTRDQRGAPNGHPQSASPPSMNRRRPLSYNQFESHNFPVFDDHRSQMPSFGNRRSSMYSPSRYSPQPPLPHQPQPHFYGAPDPTLAILAHQTPGLVPGERGYYCGFDKVLVGSSKASTRPSDNVVLTGYEGGISAHAVTKKGISQLWNLEGLRGAVYNAKILPWTIDGVGNNSYPLVAVVIHGPVWRSTDESSGDDLPVLEKSALTPTESLQGSPQNPAPRLHEPLLENDEQTTVEVFSIPQNRHVATLLALPRKGRSASLASRAVEPPQPDGSLTIQAENGYVVVASGVSGEIWIFRQGDMNTSEGFVCAGKIWTTVQHGITVEPIHNGPHGDWNPLDPKTGRMPYKASILSLSGRWLAYCPPSPSSQLSLGAIVLSNFGKSRVPGLNARAPPQLPAVNCLVETPGGDSMVKQILQVGTQKFIEGANYLGGQGVQAWNNYWNKPSQSQASTGFSYQPHQSTASHFPPTHAGGVPAPLVAKEPGLISVLDLGSLLSKTTHGSQSVHPLATFRVPHGCSFLSFAPSGLALFTASSKGDVQFVWDLMRIQYAKSSFMKGGIPGAGTQSPHVRQIAQFSRMTIARIVDVVWTSPHGERAAMVTEPGTVHILDLPASAFIWPPPRRKSAISKPEEEATSSLTAAGMATSAVTSLWTVAKPLVSGRRQSTTGMSPMNVTAQAGHGTQAIAAGISRSVGAATGRMNELRKSGIAKLHLPTSSNIPARGCAMLLNKKRSDSVIVVAGGVVRLYTIKNRRADRPADKQKASRGAKYVEFRLPPLPVNQDVTRTPNQPDDFELTEGDLEAEFRGKTLPDPASRQHGTESSIPQAEIESNAPYQPFHTDRRVGLYVYTHSEDSSHSPSGPASITPLNLQQGSKPGTSNTKSTTLLAFGGPIKSSRLDVGPPQMPEDDLTASIEQSRALPSSAIERVMRITDSTENMEQIVITTRRRKGVPRGGVEAGADGDEEGFFEDDCEVLDFASQRV